MTYENKLVEVHIGLNVRNVDEESIEYKSYNS